jgi:hypothetical protein
VTILTSVNGYLGLVLLSCQIIDLSYSSNFYINYSLITLKSKLADIVILSTLSCITSIILYIVNDCCSL